MTVNLKRATTQPYVDYYRSEQISPVHQDISNLEVHFQRRESLYRSLGILPRLVRGAMVLEIGPGSGHNAVYTAALEPLRYVFVDANPIGLREARELLGKRFPQNVFEFVEGFVEALPPGVTFDIVLAEGLLSAQHDPGALARTIGGHVSSDGLFVITCMDYISYVSEMTRRIVAQRLVPASLPFGQRVAELVKLFKPHLDELRGMSRSHEDWVMDNITHPLPGPLFAFDDAVQALGEEFDFYGSSPDFVVDWRWYKQLHSGERNDNGRAIRAYRENRLAMLDYRIVPKSVDPEVAQEAQSVSHAIYRTATGVDFGELIDFDAAIDLIERLALIVADAVPSASSALRECRDILEGRLHLGDARDFALFFGRGQQYLSFTRRHGGRA